MDETALPRPWRGQTKAGTIVISAQQALAGYGPWIYWHESTHDSLIKNTPFGQAQLLLWSLTQEAFPQGELQSHARRLLDLTVAASVTTQEGAATYVAAPAHGKTPDLPQEYDAAAGLFGWLDDRVPDREMAAGIAATLAAYALRTPLLDAWFDDDLLTFENLDAHLADPRNRPDDRLPLVIDAAERLGPDVLSMALMPGPVDLLGSLLRASDVPISDPSDVEDYHALAHRFNRELRERFALSPVELAALDRYDQLPDMAYPVQTRSEFSTVVDTTFGRSYAVIPPEDWASVMHHSELLVVAANTGDHSIPGEQSYAGAVSMLAPDRTLVRSYSDQLTATFSPTIDELRDLLAVTPESVALCARSLSYDFAAGEFSPGLFAGRRHLVLVGAPPIQLFLDLRMARCLAGETQVVVSVVRHEPGSELAYLLIRPRSKPSPIAVLPAVVLTLSELVRMLDATSTLSVRAAPLHELVDAAGLSDLERLLTWFAERAPQMSDEYGAGFGPGPAA